MIREKHLVHLLGLFYALFGGTLLVAAIRGLWPDAPAFLKYLIPGVFIVGFYFVGVWVLFRKRELDRKVPTPSQELLRQKKKFYDSLDSQSRR